MIWGSVLDDLMDIGITPELHKSDEASVLDDLGAMRLPTTSARSNGDQS